ncbi:MAG TPA: glutaredoxin family protein [Thermoanaerobaculia bacterium]|nr:glutaredoxin family protein [Thermoanaerobaculia bacterium]
MIRLRLLSRPDCHLCEAMRTEVEALLGETPREWEVVDVGSDAELSRRYANEIPVLFVNGRLFAKVRLPRLAARLRLLRAAGSKLEP